MNQADRIFNINFPINVVASRNAEVISNGAATYSEEVVTSYNEMRLKVNLLKVMRQ